MKQLGVIVVEDDELCREMVKAALQGDGHLVRCAASMGGCRKLLAAGTPDIIVLGRGLPDGDGLQLCLTLKNDPLFKAIPILMLSGKSEATDKVLGLRFGADDYLAKPFDIEELRARVDAIIRRIYGALSPRLAGGGIIMDLKARTVAREEAPAALINLTKREFALLRLFLENPGTALSRDSIIAAVWRDARPSDAKVVDVTVMNLRRKLGGGETPICAVRSFGYKFVSRA